VKIASRILFKNGAKAAAVVGTTVPGSSTIYSLFAAKGTTMAVTLSRASAAADLGIWGFVDEQLYLVPETGKTIFKITVPVTQDYIIEIIPRGDKATRYILEVSVQ
jgi:hypothetical protein